MSIFDDLERDEGYNLEAYPDSEGIWTIGVGHNIEANGIDKEVLVIMAMKGLIRFDDETARLQLSKDIRIAEDICKKLFVNWDNLTQERKDVLLNMAFNLGYKRFSGFEKTIKAVNSGNWNKAADEILDSDAGRKFKTRYKKLAHIMRGDDA